MAFKGGGGSFKSKPKFTRKKKPVPLPPAVREAVQSVSSTAKRTAAREEAASEKRVAKATPVLKSKGIGGLPNQQKIVRRAVRKSDAKVEQAIRRLPTEGAYEDARLEARRGKEEAARKGVATGTVRAFVESRKRGELLPPVSAADLASAIRQGYGKVGGKHGLQQKAELEITPQGDIGLVGRRKFLPDTRQIVVPKEYRPYRPKSIAKVDLVKRQSAYVGTAKAGTPTGKVAMTALDVAARPAYAVAGGVNAAVKGKNVAKGAGAGLTGKSKVLFGDILRDLGVPKGVAAAGGFALDVVADPTTYVTGGAGSLARKSAEDAAKAAVKKSLAAGLSNEQAARMAARAYKQTFEKAAKNDVKGATINVAGKEIPGVRKATGKTVGRAGQKTVGKLNRTKRVVADVNPNMAPAGVSRDVADKATMAARTARGSLQAQITKAQNEAAAIRKALGKNDSQVIDAIEHGTINDLPEDLRKVAITLRSRYRQIQRLEKRAGVKGGTVGGKNTKPGEPKSYVPHPVAEYLEKGKGVDETPPNPAQVGKRVIRPGHAKGRAEDRRKPLSVLREEHPGVYSEDAALAYSNRMQAGHASVQQANLNRRLSDLGENVKPGQAIHLGDGESVYRLQGSNLKKLDRDEARRLANGKIPGGAGRFVVLNDQLVDRALSSYRSMPTSKTGVGRVFDKAQGTWKTVALATPGFHIRNLIGDSQNAYLNQPVPKLARNLQHSRRALKRANKTENAQRTLGAQAKPSRRYGVLRDPREDGLRIDGRFMSYDQLAEEAAGVGAIKSGFTSREVPEQLHSGAKGGVKRVRVRTGNAKRHVTRALQNREDLIRLATYIAGRQKGMAPEEAAHNAMRYHFDYANLTDFERNVARRIAPFYTFTARNIPLQARSFVTKPGKYANYEKLRQETANALGLPDDWQDNLDEWTDRQVGLPLPGGSVASFGSPIADLGELPGLLRPGKQLDEWAQKFVSMWSPLFKTPLELFTNYSFFFRNQIESDDAPLVTAPAWVGALPSMVRKNLGAVQGIDKRTGQKVWKWPGKTQYLVKAFSPGLIGQGQNLATTGTDRRGRGELERVFGVAGVTVTPTDKVTNQINDLFEKLGEVNKKQAAARQGEVHGKPVSADNPTPEYKRLLRQAQDINAQIYALSSKRGDADPLGARLPKGRLSPEQQLQREFEDFERNDMDADEKLRREFEAFK